jgi:hypothetical protein|tara:strand:- start:5564 stop:5680 length:117 start_codon:yes stop_codon:yes gene_type:complete
MSTLTPSQRAAIEFSNAVKNIAGGLIIALILFVSMIVW